MATRVRCPACRGWILIAETPHGPWAFDPEPVADGTHTVVEVAGRLWAQQLPELAAGLFPAIEAGDRFRTHERTCALRQARGPSDGLYERWVIPRES